MVMGLLEVNIYNYKESWQKIKIFEEDGNKIFVYIYLWRCAYCDFGEVDTSQSIEVTSSILYSCINQLSLDGGLALQLLRTNWSL